MRQLCLALVISLGLLGIAHADEKFSPVPALDGEKNTLQIRQVDFTGGASGQVIVDVRNAGQRAQTFKARGLYFVPRGAANSAPQRVGAAGPFEMQDGNSWQRKDQLQIPPGKTVRLKLQTFCLDSHRGSPGKGQGYKIAHERLPKSIMVDVEDGARRILKDKAGNVPEANGAIQSHVWSVRNKKWIKLEGERANEKSDSSNTSNRYNQRLMPQQRQYQYAE